MNALLEPRLTQGVAIAVLDRVNEDGGFARQGSLGCLVRQRRSGDLFLLSAHHVLYAKSNRAGHPVFAVSLPGAPCIGEVALGRIGAYRYCSCEYFLDVALLRIGQSMQARAGQPVRVAAAPGVGERVTKFGAGTGFTEGVVVDIDYPDRWYFEYRAERAPRQVRIEGDDGSFAEQGDSGAAVFNERDELVALLWGSNARGEGIACPILPVIDALGLDMRKACNDKGVH
jgi:hypothetical protein